MEDKILNILLDMQSDIKELKTDVNGLKTDVKGLKSDVVDLKAKVTNIEGQLGEFKEQRRIDSINLAKILEMQTDLSMRLNAAKLKAM